MTAARARGIRLGGSAVLAATLALATVLSAASARPPENRPKSSPTVPAALILPGNDAPSSPASGSVLGRVAVSAITIDVVLSQRASRAGKPVQVQATLTNHSGAVVGNLSVHLVASPDRVSVRPAGGRLIRRLAPGAASAVTWIACARDPGTYAIAAHAELDGTRIGSAPALLTITGSGSC